MLSREFETLPSLRFITMVAIHLPSCEEKQTETIVKVYPTPGNVQTYTP